MDNNEAKIKALKGYLADPRPELIRNLADSELEAHLTAKNNEILQELISDLEARKASLEHELVLKQQLLNGRNQPLPLPLPTQAAVQCLDVISGKYLTEKMALGSPTECNDLFKQLLVLAPEYKWLKVTSSPLVDFLVTNSIVEYKFDGGHQIRMW